MSLRQLGNPGSSRELSNLHFSSIFSYKIREDRNSGNMNLSWMWEGQQPLNQSPPKSLQDNAVGSSFSSLHKRFPKQLCDIYHPSNLQEKGLFRSVQGFSQSQKEAPGSTWVAKKMSACKWGWSEHILKLKLSEGAFSPWHLMIKRQKSFSVTGSAWI